ncbi:unnamed protein product [Danaus chrysippus]|uniref:(African queen) hypothetical protein n=1 Tax=Danaus chrysippus TaxID=151541 RepID=A0A8J2W3X3_9NEOP|nr:unnamed protein product [Danaus chrysippus]
MRCASFLLGLVLFVSVHCQNYSLPAAKKCDPEKCKLPSCRCSSTEIPGNLKPRNTPQFVLLTFDDGVNVVNIETYRDILYNRVNSNKCPIGVTFFVSHEYTDYSLVNELYNRGFEIALHSITHKSNQTYWKEATLENVTREFVDQRILMSRFANIPRTSMQGIRSPFIQLSGDSTFQMIKDNGLTYDLSWPTVRFTGPGLWPYTLDYSSIQDCIVPPCPTASIPGVWVIPMISWTDLMGFPCSFVDGCYSTPDLKDEDAWFQFIVRAFERHYLGNRAPFGFYVHEGFVRVNPAVKRALVRFINMIQNMHDAFLVNANEVVNWVKNPVPLNEFVKQDCPRFVPAACRRTTCSGLREEESGDGEAITKRDIDDLLAVLKDSDVFEDGLDHDNDDEEGFFNKAREIMEDLQGEDIANDDETCDELTPEVGQVSEDSGQPHIDDEQDIQFDKRKLIWKIGLVLFVSVHCQNDSLPAAEKCDPEKCKLPSCRCSSTEIPGNLEPRDTPQFVLLTFDDAVTTVNIETYRDILYNRVNSNKCPIGVTFFVSHEYTDYSLVNELYNRGFEIALHSITHKSNQTYWKEATLENVTREFVDQRILMSRFANIPRTSMQGIRSPFIQLSGDSTFQMIKDNGLTYDLSWPTVRFTGPGLWPYTLDYSSIQDCIVPPCPTASIPGVWVIPMISWTDLMGFPCSFVDGCYSTPDLKDENAWFQFIVRAFERHYLGNRAPFGFYVHEGFVRVNPAVKRALVRFINMIQNMHDAFLVNANEVVNWVKNPVPLNEFVKQDCPRFVPAACRRTTCSGLKEEESGNTYYMRICNRCPRVYPWLNNPRGV